MLRETRKNFYQTFPLLKQAYRYDVLGRTQFYAWLTRYKSGRQSIENDYRPGIEEAVQTQLMTFVFIKP